VCCCRLEFGWWPNSNKAAQPKEEEERGWWRWNSSARLIQSLSF
jgi:hypothetical protein